MNIDKIKQRIVGVRKIQEIAIDADANLLMKGIMFNDEIHKTFQTKDNGVPRGVYYFKTHEESNEHQENCIANKMAKIAMERENGTK